MAEDKFAKFGGAEKFAKDVRDMIVLGSTYYEVAQTFGLKDAIEALQLSNEARAIHEARDHASIEAFFKAPPSTEQDDVDVSLDDADAFLLKAKRLAKDHYNSKLPSSAFHITLNDVYIVWFSKVLQNWKALVSTNISGDGVYYELTYNGNTHEAYVDVYSKIENLVVPD